MNDLSPNDAPMYGLIVKSYKVGVISIGSRTSFGFSLTEMGK